MKYQVGVAGFYSAPGDNLIDLTHSVSYNPLKPGLWAAGAEASMIYIADPGTGLDIHRNAAALHKDPLKKLLILNLHNQNGRRAQITRVIVRP